MKKSSGVIGAGNIGQAVTKHLLNAGFPVVILMQPGFLTDPHKNDCLVVFETV